MKNSPENTPSQNPEKSFESLSDREKFEIILGLFGTAAAQDAFVELCKNYIRERKTQISHTDAETYREETRASYSPPRRAEFHNRIMDTLRRLSLLKLTSLQKKVLYEMSSREVAAKIIHAGISGEKDLDFENDEDQTPGQHPQGQYGDEFDVSFYHSLGKGE